MSREKERWPRLSLIDKRHGGMTLQWSYKHPQTMEILSQSVLQCYRNGINRVHHCNGLRNFLTIPLGLQHFYLISPGISNNSVVCSSPYMIYILYLCIMSVCMAMNEYLVKCPRASDQLGASEALCHALVLWHTIMGDSLYTF